jgi:phosphoribosylformylglycinamidine synthase
MAFAGGFGAHLDVDELAATHGAAGPVVALFSESNTRFLCEIEPDKAGEFEHTMASLPCVKIGEVSPDDRFVISLGDRHLVDASIQALKEAWQAPFRW